MSGDDEFLRFLRVLAENTARELWKVARNEVTDSRLVLPTYRSGERRVSEQEARSISQRLVAKSRYFFSIETPTRGLHRFSGNEASSGRSAQHDLSFYTTADPTSLIAHAEFKQGHRSGDSGIKVISKDLIKLLDSNKHCLWFHSFPKPTDNEFEKLHGFFRKALDEAFSKRKAGPSKVVLGFCAVVEPAAWIAGPLTWPEVSEAIDAFPIATASIHPAWTKLGVTPDVAKTSPEGELEFVDLEEPQEPNGG